MGGGVQVGTARISIVTPSLDQAEYLEETLTSVLDQGFEGLEYVVIDGGSSDGSVDIIQSYADRLSYWVSEPDRGHADAINKGFEHTSGEIMAWINSSDVYLPWTLSTVAAVFRDVPEAQWVMGVSSYWSEAHAVTSITPTLRNKYDFLASPRCTIQQESVFWRRSLWDACGGRLSADLKLACDHELWMRFFESAPLFHVDSILAAFRPHLDRRGKVQNDEYGKECRATWELYRRQASARDRRRAATVHALRTRPGKVMRRSLRSLDLLPWDRAPRIVFDHATQTWQAV
jgi:glycosyltransferase involved in cell wall biosynthesis